MLIVYNITVAGGQMTYITEFMDVRLCLAVMMLMLLITLGVIMIRILEHMAHPTVIAIITGMVFPARRNTNLL